MIQDYLVCPAACYERHVLKKLETEKSSALEFGTALHLGLRTLLEGEDGVGAFHMYWDSIKSCHIKYYDSSWAELRELGEHFLNNFKSRHLKKFSDFQQELKMEMPFITTVEIDGMFVSKKEDHILQGTADYVGLYEGKLCIADWKSSSKAYKKNKIHHNFQMYIYAKLYQHNFGKLPEILLYKVFNKKTGTIQTIEKELTQTSLDVIFNQVETVARQMIQTFETKRLYHGADCYCEGYS